MAGSGGAGRYGSALLHALQIAAPCKLRYTACHAHSTVTGATCGLAGSVCLWHVQLRWEPDVCLLLLPQLTASCGQRTLQPPSGPTSCSSMLIASPRSSWRYGLAATYVKLHEGRASTWNADLWHPWQHAVINPPSAVVCTHGQRMMVLPLAHSMLFHQHTSDLPMNAGGEQGQGPAEQPTAQDPECADCH